MLRVRLWPMLFWLCAGMKELADYVLKNAPAGNIDAALEKFIQYSEKKRLGLHLGRAKGQTIEDSVRKGLEGLPEGAPAAVLELGCHAGDGTLSILSALKYRPGSTIISTEGNEEWLAAAKRVVAHASQGQDVRWIPVEEKGPDIQRLLGTLQAQGIERLDSMVFDHEEDLFLPDLQTILQQKLLRIGGTVQVDNVKRKARALAKYMEFVGTGRNGFSTEVLSVSDPYPDSIAISQWLGTPEL
ncbi:comta [Symbiodinium microadriaticum]|nr:comta [Symbiodinium microadriaticum]